MAILSEFSIKARNMIADALIKQEYRKADKRDYEIMLARTRFKAGLWPKPPNNDPFINWPVILPPD